MGRGEAAEVKVAELEGQLNAKFDVYENILSKQPYLSGQAREHPISISIDFRAANINVFTLADLFHLPYSKWLVQIGEGDLFN